MLFSLNFIYFTPIVKKVILTYLVGTILFEMIDMCCGGNQSAHRKLTSQKLWPGIESVRSE